MECREDHLQELEPERHRGPDEKNVFAAEELNWRVKKTSIHPGTVTNGQMPPDPSPAPQERSFFSSEMRGSAATDRGAGMDALHIAIPPHDEMLQPEKDQEAENDQKRGGD
jgi:hypothetical protein